MKTKDIKAIKKSAAHWWRHANGKARNGETIEAAHCALCQTHHECWTCPLHRSNHGCEETYGARGPWREASDALRAAGHRDSPWECNDMDFLEAAQDMFETLIWLLPKGESWTDPEGWTWYSPKPWNGENVGPKPWL